MDIQTIIILAVYSFCLWGYHFIYFYITEKKDVTTRRYMINEAILSWIERSFEKKEHLLIIHQLRNVIMAVTFLATTAVLLIGLIFGFSPTALPGPLEHIDYALWLMMFTLIFSFFNFLLCLRHFTRMTFMVRSSPDKLEKISGLKAEEYLANLFIRGNREYTLGRRSMLYGIVALIWLFNAWIFMFVTIGMTLAFILSYDF